MINGWTQWSELPDAGQQPAQMFIVGSSVGDIYRACFRHNSEFSVTPVGKLMDVEDVIEGANEFAFWYCEKLSTGVAIHEADGLCS